MKALIVKFISATVFSFPERSKDRVIDYTREKEKHYSRKECPKIQVPEGTLDVRHVNNMLHVLANERPVPTLRPSNMVHVPEITAIAQNSMVRVIKIAEESKTVKKSVSNAYQSSTLPYFLNGNWVQIKGGHLYYSRLKYYLGDELFQDFQYTFRKLVGTPKKDYTAKEVIELMNAHGDDPAVIDFARKCKEQGKTSISNLITKNGNCQSINIHYTTSKPLCLLTINSGIEPVKKYSGRIFAKVPDDQIDFFRRGTGIATFLEGGFAFIEGVSEWSEELVIGCSPVVKGEIIYVPN